MRFSQYTQVQAGGKIALAIIIITISYSWYFLKGNELPNGVSWMSSPPHKPKLREQKSVPIIKEPIVKILSTIA